MDWKKYKNLIRRIALRYADSGVPVGQLVQHVEIKLQEQSHKYNPDKYSESAWVTEIAKSTCLNTIRQFYSKKLILKEDMSDMNMISPYTADGKLNEEDRCKYILELVNKLPYLERYVISRRFGLEDFAEMAEEDLCEDLGMGRTELRTLISRALVKLGNDVELNSYKNE